MVDKNEAPAAEEAAAQPDTRTTEQKLESLSGVVLELLEQVEGIAKELATVKKTAVTKPGLFGGKREPTPLKDLKTGVIYASKASVGKTFATEVGADPLTDTFAFYKVDKALRMDDGSPRFVPASPEEGKAARDAAKAKVEKEVAEANARLEAEAAKKVEAAPAKAKK